MSRVPTKPVLLTGASGKLGRVLAKSLTDDGGTLVMTDIARFPDPVPPRAAFTQADPFAAQLAGRVSGDPVEERYMGGAFCSLGYSRSAPAPAGLFEDVKE